MNQTTLESGSSDSDQEEEPESEESQGDSEGSQEETDASGGDESKNTLQILHQESTEASSSNSMIDSLLKRMWMPNKPERPEKSAPLLKNGFAIHPVSIDQILCFF